MATVATITGNGAAPDGLWLTVSDLARQRGITKGPLSRRVARLEDQGLLTTRPGERGSKLINVAEFDKVTGETTDAVRELNGNTAKTAPLPLSTPGDPVLAREQARRAAYDADLKQLDLKERLGQVVPIDDVEAAMVRVAETMVRTIDQLPSFADDLAAAVAKDGVHGARTFLKSKARDLRDALAKNLRLLEAEGRAMETLAAIEGE